MIVQPRLRAEIRLAERLGVSPRRLWGDEPSVRLVPDGAGGFHVEREPEFTREDVDLFEAARIAEESISPRGIPVEDEIDPANQYRFKVATPDGLPVKNFAVAAQNAQRKAYEKAWPDADTGSLMWPVKLV